MNIFLEAAHLSPITVLCVEFWIPRKQEAAARVAAQLQIHKETGVMLGTITGSETNERETQGTPTMIQCLWKVP